MLMLRLRQKSEKKFKTLQQASLVLAKHYKLNQKTISRCKDTKSITDKKSGPKIRKSILTQVEQQAIYEVRRQL